MESDNYFYGLEPKRVDSANLDIGIENSPILGKVDWFEYDIKDLHSTNIGDFILTRDGKLLTENVKIIGGSDTLCFYITTDHVLFILSIKCRKVKKIADNTRCACVSIYCIFW